VVRWPAAGDTAGSSLRRLSSLQHRIYNLLGRNVQKMSNGQCAVIYRVARKKNLQSGWAHWRPHIGANGVSWPPGKMDEKLKSENMQKKSSFLCLCYILRAIRAGRCRERRFMLTTYLFRYYFRMLHFVDKFSKFSSPQAARGHWPP